MKKLSTRQRIAGSMALLTGSVVFVVAVVINILMISNLYRGERRALTMEQSRPMRFGKNISRNIVLTPQEAIVFDQRKVFDNLAKIDDNRYIFDENSNQTIARQVTGQIERQIMMVWLSFLVVVLAGGLGYGISWWLTKRLLSDIETLQYFVEGRTLSNLQESLSMEHLPQSDTITRLTDSINTTNHLLLQKIQTIKQFALYAAHELKSPVMSMQTSIELALKTQNYHKYMSRVQDTVHTMQGTIETLLMTVDAQRVDSKSERIVIKNLITSVCDKANQRFGVRDVRLKGEPTAILETSRSALATVLTNLIDNARKYHEGEDAISITRSGKQIIIINTSNSLHDSDLESLWTPFWQLKTGSTDGQGLGLSLVQSVAERMGWSVTLTLEKNQTVVTTLKFT